MRPLGAQLAGVAEPTFAIVNQSSNRNSGYVLLGQIVPIAAAPPEICQVREFRIFVQGPTAELAAVGGAAGVTGRRLASDFAASDGEPTLAVLFSEILLEEHGSDWAIYRGAFAEPVNIESVTISEAAGADRQCQPVPLANCPTAEQR